jgi:hypothetical protein
LKGLSTNDPSCESEAISNEISVSCFLGVLPEKTVTSGLPKQGYTANLPTKNGISDRSARYSIAISKLLRENALFIGKILTHRTTDFWPA